MKHKLGLFLGFSINREEKRKGERKRERKKGEEREGERGRTCKYIPNFNCLRTERIQASQVRCGLLFPLGSGVKVNNRHETTRMALNKDVKNWFSPTPIRQFFFPHF